jgi:hypothetical protein
LNVHRHEIPTRQELHDEVEVARVLEREEELDDPGRVGLCEDVSLGSDVGELVLLEHLRLKERLHGVDLAGVGFLDETDLGEETKRDGGPRGQRTSNITELGDHPREGRSMDGRSREEKAIRKTHLSEGTLSDDLDGSEVGQLELRTLHSKVSDPK